MVSFRGIKKNVEDKPRRWAAVALAVVVLIVLTVIFWPSTDQQPADPGDPADTPAPAAADAVDTPGPPEECAGRMGSETNPVSSRPYTLQRDVNSILSDEQYIINHINQLDPPIISDGTLELSNILIIPDRANESAIKFQIHCNDCCLIE
jgi:hypothetical protein